MTSQDALIKTAISEIVSPEWAHTMQILDLYEVEKTGETIAPVFFQTGRSFIASVYFAIREERFYLRIYVDKEKNMICGMDIAPYWNIYFSAKSEEYTDTELCQITTLKVSERRKQGEKNIVGHPYVFSSIHIESDNNPGTMEEKLDRFITYLYTDYLGIVELSRKVETEIMIVGEYDKGNGILGGYSLDHSLIAKISALGCSLSFDLYTSGKEF